MRSGRHRSFFHRRQAWRDRLITATVRGALALGAALGVAATAASAQATLTWEVNPPLEVAAGDPISLTWRLAGSAGTISDNQVHIGISSILASSPLQANVDGVYMHTFTAPPVIAPTAFSVVARVLEDTGGGAMQVLSEFRQVLVQPLPVPALLWTLPPPATALGGEPVPLEWSAENFAGPMTEHQVHFGIRSVLGSSPLLPGTNGAHSHTFVAPNIGTFDSPTTFRYVVRALDDGTQVLSSIEATDVSAGAAPPTVEWVQGPPAAVQSGGAFDVTWRVANYGAAVGTNAVGWGLTSLLGQTADQPGGNGLYTTTVPVPVVGGEGTLSYTAFAQNAIAFAFAPLAPVDITFAPQLTAADLFPLIPGATYSYLVNGADALAVVARSTSEDVNGVPTMVLDHTPTFGQENYTQDNVQGLAMHRVRLTQDGIPTGVLNTFSPPLTFLSPLPVVGSMVTATGTALIEAAGFEPQTVAYSGTATAAAVETITVPAGTFDTLRIESALTVGTTVNSIVLWVAPGVGRIQMQFNDNFWQLTGSSLLP